jgi:hypothetical protein
MHSSNAEPLVNCTIVIATAGRNLNMVLIDPPQHGLAKEASMKKITTAILLVSFAAVVGLIMLGVTDGTVALLS